MRLLTNSLETLQAVRGANQALDLVPVINLKLEDPSVDIPIDDDKGGQTAVGDSNVAFQRRFFNKIFNIIKDDGAVQLLAYHVAVAKGTDVDQPRNLAKSVTVE